GRTDLLSLPNLSRRRSKAVAVVHHATHRPETAEAKVRCRVITKGDGVGSVAMAVAATGPPPAPGHCHVRSCQSPPPSSPGLRSVAVRPLAKAKSPSRSTMGRATPRFTVGVARPGFATACARDQICFRSHQGPLLSTATRSTAFILSPGHWPQQACAAPRPDAVRAQACAFPTSATPYVGQPVPTLSQSLVAQPTQNGDTSPSGFVPQPTIVGPMSKN
ncbi:hypothetical protein Nepgr_033941, partial [Nepenthes gracilis]